MPVEFFLPFDRGGSEWSTYYLAQALTKKGHKVIILTPNYGTKNYEIHKGLEIIRFPFFFKLTKTSREVSPFWFTNLAWIVLTFCSLLLTISKQKIDVVHLQGKYFLPAGVLLKFLWKIPLVATIRDYQILCPYGLCLTKERNYQRCNLVTLASHDFPIYLKNYKFNLPTWVLFVAGLRGWLVARALLWCAKNIGVVVSISKKQQRIFAANGLATQIIYNMFHSPGQLRVKREKDSLIYIGRLTPGKGITLLVEAFKILAKKYTHLKLYVVGQGILKRKLSTNLDLKLRQKVFFPGQLPYQDTLSWLKKAAVAVVPSIWEEPFGRVALEAVLNKIPVVASDRGALAEIVEDHLTGRVVSPLPTKLAHAIEEVLKNYSKYRQAIQKSYKRLLDKFYYQPLQDHLKLYQQLLKRKSV